MASPAIKLNNGALMPVIGLGTWKSKKGEVGKAVKLALQHGYKHVDCAHAYQNEDEIGEALTEVFQEGKVKREDIFITSKLWCDSHAPEDVLPSCETTLKNLKLNYLDLYLIHIPVSFKRGVMLSHSVAEGTLGYSADRIAKTWEAMEELVEKGLCKSIGISNFTKKKTETLLETARIKPTCNQVELHPYLPQQVLKKYNDEKGIVLAAYSPLGSPDRPFVGKDEPIILDNPVLRKVAEKHNTTIALVALSWGIHRGTPVLPKAVSENHIRENLDALNLKLDGEDMKAIEDIGIKHRYFKMTWMFKPDEVPKDHWDGEE